MSLASSEILKSGIAAKERRERKKNREWTRIDANKDLKTETNRRWTQIYADRMIRKHMDYY
jgi:hypothetical protein